LFSVTFTFTYLQPRTRHAPAANVNVIDTVPKLYHNNNMAGVGDVGGCSRVFSSCRLIVDGNLDSGHTASDNTNSSCSWDTEDVSISRLHLGL